MSEKKYPIGGYGPGAYQRRCGTCGGGFIGDKRAFQCEPCALNDRAKFDALSPAEQEELRKRNAKAINEAFKDWAKVDPPQQYPGSEVYDESPAEQPVADKLPDDQIPDLSGATPEQKAETINGLVKLCAKNVLKMFYAFGLKTHIECTVVNDPTNEAFDFIFRKRTPEQPVLPTFWDVAKAFKWAAEYGNEQGEEFLLLEGQWQIIRGGDDETGNEYLTPGNVAELYCLQNGFEKNEQPVREVDDRNEFAEWCRMQHNYGFIRGMGWKCEITHELFSTDFMYNLFKEQKDK